MSKVAVRNITKQFGRRNPVTVLNGISIDIEDGELLVLLGPSGCGKTTLLRTIAGLEEPLSGSISISGRPVVDVEQRVNVPPHKRRVGMVFQNYALWPHMTVRDNVAYPLRARGVSARAARPAAEEILGLLQCDHLLGRYPSELSGGQQQRVALGRSLVGSPETVLFDEPLSNLDAQLRRDVRSQIHRLHNELGFTAVYVTHDLLEALELGDRIAVMRDGVIEQIGSPGDVYESPRTAYVAQFFGVENKIPCERTAAGVRSPVGNLEGAWDRLVPPEGDSFDVFVRASSFHLVDGHLVDGHLVDGAGPGPSGEGECVVRGGVVGDVLYGGGTHHHIVDCGPARFTSSVPSSRGPRLLGDAVDGVFRADDALVYPHPRDGEAEPAETPTAVDRPLNPPLAKSVTR